MFPTAMIDVRHLTKSFGDLVAVNDVTFSVYEGEIFAFLGPMVPARVPPSVCCVAFFCRHPVKAMCWALTLRKRLNALSGGLGI